MKREIKFRAWFEGQMINRGLHDRNWYNSDDKLVKGTHPDDDYYLEVMQFTGLKDKNGNDIYESDILKHHGIVAWNDVEHRWSAIDLNWNDKREWHAIDYLTSPFEIIGNIHENKNLLKN